MKIIQSPLELKENLNKLENIFLIPTMGNLHEGHISLIKEAKKLSETYVSPFLLILYNLTRKMTLKVIQGTYSRYRHLKRNWSINPL